MKKTVVLIVAILVSVCAMAQTKQHMKFMGIPMGVSITTFQQKLIAKGLKYDQKASKLISAGCRKFTGTFAGYKVDIYTYYDTKDSKVYRSKVMIDRYILDEANQVFYDIVPMIRKKYPSAILRIPNEPEPEYEEATFIVDEGYIQCYVSKFAADWNYRLKDLYTVSIDYWDSKAVDQHESNRMDDL